MNIEFFCSPIFRHHGALCSSTMLPLLSCLELDNFYYALFLFPFHEIVLAESLITFFRLIALLATPQ